MRGCKERIMEQGWLKKQALSASKFAVRSNGSNVIVCKPIGWTFLLISRTIIRPVITLFGAVDENPCKQQNHENETRGKMA